MKDYAADAPNCGRNEVTNKQTQPVEKNVERSQPEGGGRSKEPTEYECFWPNKFVTSGATSLDELLAEFEWAVNLLRELKAAGGTLEDDCLPEDDGVSLVTTDPMVAKKFKFIERDYEWLEDEDFEDEDFEDEEDEPDEPDEPDEDEDEDDAS